jgi:hypothetical protein
MISWASQPGARLRKVVLEADAPPLPRGAAAFQRSDCPLNCTSRARSSKLYIGTSECTFLSPDLPRCNLAVRFSALIGPGDEELRALVYWTHQKNDAHGISELHSILKWSIQQVYSEKRKERSESVGNSRGVDSQREP